MPSHPESETNAETMRQAARALARSSRSFPDPDEMYDVLGSITYTLGALSQSLGQIGSWHRDHADRAAHDDGNRAAGAGDAVTVTAQLQRAAIALDVAIDAVMTAHNANGRIAWQPGGATLEATLRAWSTWIEAGPVAEAPLRAGTGPHLI